MYYNRLIRTQIEKNIQLVNFLFPNHLLCIRFCPQSTESNRRSKPSLREVAHRHLEPRRAQRKVPDQRGPAYCDFHLLVGINLICHALAFDSGNRLPLRLV